MNQEKSKEFFRDVFVEFIEVVIHQVVFLMKIYPDSIFVNRRKFNIPVKMSNHPWVNNYIDQVLETFKKNVESDNIDFDNIDIVVSNKTRDFRDKFRIEFNKLHSDIQRIPIYMHRIEMNLASIVMRLSSAVTSLQVDTREEEEREWWVEVSTVVGGARQLMQDKEWCLAETEAVQTKNIIPVMAVNIPFKLQIYIETSRW